MATNNDTSNQTCKVKEFDLGLNADKLVEEKLCIYDYWIKRCATN